MRVRRFGNGGRGQRRRHVLQVRQILAVHPVARERDRERDGADRSPTTVTLNATRRSWLSWAVLPLASPVSAGDSGISVPISPSAGPNADQDPGPPEPLLGGEVEIRECLVELVVRAWRRRATDDEVQSRGHLGAAGDAVEGRLGPSHVAGVERYAGAAGSLEQSREAAPAAAVQLYQVAAELVDDECEGEPAPSGRTGICSADETWKIAWSIELLDRREGQGHGGQARVAVVLSATAAAAARGGYASRCRRASH